MRHVVALSGGKDSTALALRLRELHPSTSFDYICTPTGNELPELFQHLERMEEMLGKELIRLQPFSPGDGLVNIVRDQGMIPNFRARFCTRMLKIEPTIEWLERHSPVTHYVGLRADEGDREGIYGEIEGVTHAYPFRDWGWGIDDVWDYLDRLGVRVPVRTDCAWCYHQRLYEWWNLWRKQPAAYEAAVKLEAEMGHTFRSPGRDTWPVGLAELRARFEAGHRPRGAESQLQGNLFNCDMDMTCRVCTL